MSRDILFKTDDFIFSYRVGGLLIRNDKILLQKPRNDYHSIIGGPMYPALKQLLKH